MDYGCYRHEWVEELQELSVGEHAHLFRSGKLFPRWKPSPGDTGERVGIAGKRDSFQATSACSSWFTAHFPRAEEEPDESSDLDSEEQEMVAEELQAVMEEVLERDLTEGEEQHLAETVNLVTAVDVALLVDEAEALLPNTRTRADYATQRADLLHKTKKAVCDVNGVLSVGRIERLVEQRQSRQAKRACNHKADPTTNPYQRSAAKWLATAMGLPACVAPVSTDAEYELFMRMYMKLSQNGKCGVNYQQMCSEWNEMVMAEMKEILAEMKEIQAVASDVEVDQLLQRLRLKTSCQLSTYSSVLTDRYQGVKALAPYLDEYKQLCHDLKEADADDVLSSPQIECRALTPKPTARLVISKTQLPMPSNFAGVNSTRAVRIKSVALHPRDESAAPSIAALNSKPVGSDTPSSRPSKSKAPRTDKDWQLELCSQCWIRKQTKEVVYVQHPNGESQSFHGGRQRAGNAQACPKFVRALDESELKKWNSAKRAMQRKGELQELYEQI
jgi:phage FluMu protein gp41